MLVLIPALIAFSTLAQKASTWTEQQFSPGFAVSSPSKLAKNKDTPSVPGLTGSESWTVDGESYVLDAEVGTVKDPSKSSTGSLFNASITSIYTSEDDVVVGEKDLMVQGWTGIAVTVRQALGVTIVSRIYRVGDKVLTLSGGYETAKPRPAAIDKFLDSLKLGSNGTATASGPELNRFPLADLGVSALFPSEPEKNEDFEGKPPHRITLTTFTATYANVVFTVTNDDEIVGGFSGLTEKSLATTRSAMIDQYLTGMNAKKVKSQEISIGDDKALCVDITRQGNFAGRVVCLINKTHAVIAFVYGPACYDHSALVERFFHGIEFKNDAGSWQDQTLTSGVTIATPVKLSKLDVPVHDPTMLRVDLWQARKGRINFVAGVSELKPSTKISTSELLENSVGGMMASNKNSVLVAAHDVMFQGWPGIDITVQQPPGVTLDVRFCFAKSTLVTMIGSYVTADKQSPDVRRFLDSFHFPSAGTADVAGPALARFPLGDSGISAMFPASPAYEKLDFGHTSPQKVMHRYAATYCLRGFVVAYVEVPAELAAHPPTESDLMQLESAITDDTLASLKAKQTKQLDDHVGKEYGLRTDFTFGDKHKGRVFVFLHQNRVICVLAVSPDVLEDPKLIDQFMHSIEFKQ